MIDNHIKIALGFEVGSTEPIDSRLILSKDDMAKVGNDSEGQIYALPRWPDKYFCLCTDNGQIYEFDKALPAGQADEGLYFKQITFQRDDQTIVLDNDGKLSVPIDGETIVLDGGLLKAVPEELLNGVATEVKYDSEGKETVNVLFDDASLLVDALNKLAVKVDGLTVEVGANGLEVNFENHVDNRTIKINSEGKFEAQYEADEKSLHLDGVKFEAIVDGDTIIVDNSEGLKATFLRYEGSEGIDITDKYVKVLVDNKTVKVGADGLEVMLDKALEVDSEGLSVKVDGHSVVLDANEKLRVPVQDLLHSASEGVLALDRSVADELTLSLRHDATLIETSEGLHVVARQAVASEGIIVVPEGETSIISVDFDHKSIQLGSEGLFVKVKDKSGLAFETVNGLKVLVDDATVMINSEGKLTSTSTPLLTVLPLKKETAADGTITLSIDYDSLHDVNHKKTIQLGSEGLFVPIDGDSIFLKDGKIVAKKQVFADSETIIEDSEHILHVNLDKKTLVYNATNGAIETAVGGWVESPSTVHFIDVAGQTGSFTNIGGGIWRYEGTIGSGFSPVPGDGQEVDVVLTPKVGGISVPVVVTGKYKFIDYGTYIATGDSSPTDELVNLSYEKATGKFTIDVRPADATAYSAVNNLDLDVSGVLGIYHPIGAQFVPVDGTSIIVKNGVLSTSAPSITAGAGLEYTITPTANILDILTDSESIAIRGDHLYIPILVDRTAAEEDLVLAINSEGKPEWLKRAGVTDVLIDGRSLVENYEVIIPDASDSERGVVKFDNDTLVLNSEGQLKVVNLVEDALVKELMTTAVSSEGVRTKITSEGTIVDPADRIAKLDLTAYSKLDETAYRVELLMDGVNHYDKGSEGDFVDSEAHYILSAKVYDQDGNLLTTANEIDLPLEHMITNARIDVTPLSDGTSLNTLVFIFRDGHDLQIPMEALTGGYITQYGDYTGSNSIYGTKNFAGELMNYGFEVITQGQMDEKTTFWDDSEQVLKAILPDGHKAIELKDLGTKYEYNVLYDEETILLNSENELYVPLDKKTIIISEGKVAANIDNETIIYDDSEKVVKLPIDQVTIYINSEGLLEAAGLDVKAGKAIEIESSEEGGLPVKKINVLYDEKTIDLNSEGKLEALIDKDSIIINSEGLLEVDQYTIAEIKDLWHSICVEGEN